MTSKKILKLTALMMSIAGPVLAADMFVFPKNNQTKDQQDQDEFSCYKWAKEQTGFDPNKPVEQAATQAPKGGAASGAAKGAAVGAAGAHKRRKGEKQQEAAQQQAAKQQEANVEGYHRAFGACMEGKGYTVK